MLDHSEDRQVPISLGGIMWICEKCGSKEVQQEFSVMLPMNSEDGWEQAIENCYGNDFYYCEQCDDECDPIRKQEEKT